MISGTLACILTITPGLLGIKDFIVNFHVLLGAIILLLVLILTLYGYFALYYQRYRGEWNSGRVAKIKLPHKILGYILLLISQVAIVTGVMNYVN